MSTPVPRGRGDRGGSGGSLAAELPGGAKVSSKPSEAAFHQWELPSGKLVYTPESYQNKNRLKILADFGSKRIDRRFQVYIFRPKILRLFGPPGGGEFHPSKRGFNPTSLFRRKFPELKGGDTKKTLKKQ